MNIDDITACAELFGLTDTNGITIQAQDGDDYIDTPELVDRDGQLTLIIQPGHEPADTLAHARKALAERGIISSQVRTVANPAGQPDEHLESVLGTTPHEFESRILRRSEAPPRSLVRGFCVPRLIWSLVSPSTGPPRLPPPGLLDLIQILQREHPWIYSMHLLISEEVQ
jgi:hypothetical protein